MYKFIKKNLIICKSGSAASHHDYCEQDAHVQLDIINSKGLLVLISNGDTVAFTEDEISPLLNQKYQNRVLLQ